MSYKVKTSTKDGIGAGVLLILTTAILTLLFIAISKDRAEISVKLVQAAIVLLVASPVLVGLTNWLSDDDDNGVTWDWEVW